MSITSPSFKQWGHQGNLVPKVEYSEGTRPHGEFLPAPWLPLDDVTTAGGVYDKYVEEYFSIMPGKVLAFSCEGHLVPAGILKHWKNAGSGAQVLEYKAIDVTQKVIDLGTGSAVTAAKTYTKSALLTALQNRGLLRSNEQLQDFISAPVGVAPYAYYQAMANGDPNNPSNLRLHNFNLQHRTAVLCDYVLELPWVPEQKAATDASDLGTVASYTATQPKTYYIEFTDTAYMPIAQSVPRAAWTFSNDSSSIFVTQKTLLRDVKATGDYWIDDSMGRLYFHHGGGSVASATSDVNAVQILFYHYNSTNDPSGIGNYACVVGPVCPGDLLKPTDKSNWMPVTQANAHFAYSTAAGTAALDGLTFSGTALQAEVEALRDAVNDEIDNALTMFGEIAINAEEQAMSIGQVLEVESQPKDSLELVRTAGQTLAWTQYLDKMPGSATEGLSDQLTYAGGANKVVRVNIIRR